MIIEETFTEGMFGQILLHILEILPYLKRHDLRPKFIIKSIHYGDPENNYNIFPSIIKTTYIPPSTNTGDNDIIKLQHLRKIEGHPKYSFHKNFQLAHDLFFEYFEFNDMINQNVSEMCAQYFTNKNVLGIHYRGTDKNKDKLQTNNQPYENFFVIVSDFLSTRNDVDVLFVSTDEAQFLDYIKKYIPSRIKVVSFDQQRWTPNDVPFRCHQLSSNKTIAETCCIDALLLSKCRTVIKTTSQLSSWAKIFNPDLEIYRTNCFKHDWFPEAYLPKYVSNDTIIQQLLNKNFEMDFPEDRKYIHTPHITNTQRVRSMLHRK